VDVSFSASWPPRFLVHSVVLYIVPCVCSNPVRAALWYVLVGKRRGKGTNSTSPLLCRLPSKVVYPELQRMTVSLFLHVAVLRQRIQTLPLCRFFSRVAVYVCFILSLSLFTGLTRNVVKPTIKIQAVLQEKKKTCVRDGVWWNTDALLHTHIRTQKKRKIEER
jgi:hypothetical protein